MSAEVAQDLTWLDELLNQLPALPRRRKTIFDILGNATNEVQMSALLAFYLDQDEEHGFRDLFLRSLLDVLDERGLLTDPKWKDVRTDEVEYTVTREWSTKGRNKKYIDLVVTGPQKEYAQIYEWAILIEHKINAWVYNPLDLYAQAVDADPKVCVVLAPDVHALHHAGWHSITHTELLRQVKRNLAVALPGADDRHLLMLREFLLNLDTDMKTNEDLAHRQRMNTLNAFNKQVHMLDHLREELNKHVIAALDAAMNDRGFKQEQKTGNTMHRMYYAKPKKFHADDGIAWAFRIWVPVHLLTDTGKVTINFELAGKENTVHAGVVKRSLGKAWAFQDTRMREGVGGAEGQAFCHVLVVNAELDRSIPVRQGLDQLLDETLFRNGNQLITLAISTFEQAKSAA